MSIQYETRVLPDHLRLDCSGPYALDDAIRVYEQAFELAAAASREAVLIDVQNVTGTPPAIMERYELAVHLAALQAARTPRIRLAVIGYEPLIHRERFGEIVATNRGAVARAFTDEKQALEWLLLPQKPR